MKKNFLNKPKPKKNFFVNNNVKQKESSNYTIRFPESLPYLTMSFFAICVGLMVGSNVRKCNFRGLVH